LREWVRAMRKGISQEIAIMVIVAVTISIAAAFIGWLHTLMSSVKQPEILKIYPADTFIEKQGDSWILRLHLLNQGSSPAEIYKIVIMNKEVINVNITVDPMEEKVVNITLKKDYAPHTMYALKIYTKTGNIYNALTTYIQSK